MKKLTLLLLALTLALTVSCGEVPPVNDDTSIGDTDTETTASEAVTTDAVTEDTAPADTVQVSKSSVFTAVLDNGVTVIIGGDADELISALGDSLNYMEAPSCIHEGFDKVYTYDGYSITTSPAADKTQYIAELSLLSDVVALDGGLMIGSDVSDVEAVFGTDFEEQFGVRKYTVDGAAVSIVLDGDTVSGITISSTNQ